MKADCNTSKHLLLSLLFLFLTCQSEILLHADTALAQNASIKDFTASNSKSQLLLYFTVTDCFTAEMEKAVHNGIPVTFTFFVEIYRQRRNWPDSRIKKYEFNHVMEYDSLKKEYKVRREEKNDSRMTSSLGEAKMLMSEINGFGIMPLEEIDPNAFYNVKVKAELAKKTLPLYFHYLIPFTSLWDFETDWHELKLHLGQ